MIRFSSFNISEKAILESIAQGGVYHLEIYSKLTERRFHIGDFGIERSVLHHWIKEGLLPYDNKEKGWQKFSLVEFTWLKTIVALRELGLNLEKIKEIKAQLFDENPEAYKKFLIERLTNYSGEIKDKDIIIKAFKSKEFTAEKWKAIITESQLSDFFNLVLQIVVNNDNVCIVIDDANKCHPVIFGNVEEKKKINDILLNDLTNKSFLLINVRKIIHGFFSDDKIAYDNGFIIGFLNGKEREIIDKIREGDVKEILITFSDNKPSRITLTKAVNPEDVINKVSRLLKKDGCWDVTVKRRNGKTMYYEQKEIIKLK